MPLDSNRKHWETFALISSEAADALHGYHPVLQQILYNRGYATHEDARRFLEARRPTGTSPFKLSGMAEAVDRIKHALGSHEVIAVYGDYDVDGVTATALLSLCLQSLGGEIIEYIPDRFSEGYGVNNKALKHIHDLNAGLVITLDCGIRSLEEASYAKSLNLDLIITDHHTPGEMIPAATAVIDPKKPGDEYPEKDLAGVGLAYKIIEALDQTYEFSNTNVHNYLDLVALGTVADLAPLIGENRYLVREGLKYLRKPQRQGIMSLIGVSGLNPQKISATDIGFILGPRLNAAGRLDSAQAALNLLTSTDVSKSAYLAQKLEVQNRERQRITKEIQEKAEALAFKEDPDPLIIFAMDESFNPGVVGLVASRITDKYYRPSIIGHVGKDSIRASCRSISEFHITNALDKCADLMVYHGGHAAAAGFTINKNNFNRFFDRMNQIAKEQLQDLVLRPVIMADIEITLAELTPNLYQYLEWLQPTGYGNPTPIFKSQNVQVKKSQVVGRDQTHLKLTLTDGWITFDAIAFRQGYWKQNLPRYIDIMYNFEKNEFRGRENFQLNIKDIKKAGEI